MESSRQWYACFSEAYSINLHNLHDLIKPLIFFHLRAMEVLGPRKQILLNVHRGELLDQCDSGLVERQAIAGQGQAAGAETNPTSSARCCGRLRYSPHICFWTAEFWLVYEGTIRAEAIVPGLCPRPLFCSQGSILRTERSLSSNNSASKNYAILCLTSSH
jgi:hypothetical protein